MSSLIKEFKEFISRGNVMDMAIGVIIGGAFTAIVTSLTSDIIQPFIHIVTGGGTEVSGLDITVGDTTIGFSNFISAVINFLIVALIVFFLAKAVNTFEKTGAKLLRLQQEEEEAVGAPTCPHCLEEVKEGATRCPHCGGEIPGGAKVA